MKCPTCTDVTLVMTERQDIEIDYCPQCRGVWLDRGELDKLIERANSPKNMQEAPPINYYKNSDEDYKKEHHYKKRKSFLSDIFD